MPMPQTTRNRRLLPAALSLGALAAAVLLVAACSPTTVLNALAPRDTASVTTDVPYASGDRRKLDVWRPATAAPAAGWPVVVFFYGGTWNQGDRAEYRFVGEALASRGILTLIADYRLYPEVTYPDFMVDSAKALAWGLDRARSLGGDPKRVFVFGHSAGGYNAAMLALDERWLKAEGHAPSELAGWVGLAGPYNFLPSRNPDVQPVFHHPDYPKAAQPVEHTAGSSPPAFLGAARNDKLVDPQRSTVGLARKLEAAGTPVTLHLYDHVSHTTLIGAFAAPLRFLSPVLDDVSAFIHATPPAGGKGLPGG